MRQPHIKGWGVTVEDAPQLVAWLEFMAARRKDSKQKKLSPAMKRSTNSTCQGSTYQTSRKPARPGAHIHKL
jgi:hypothetical protein